MSDDEFLSCFEANTLGSFGHDAKLRAIYLLLLRTGRSKGRIDDILQLLQNVEKDNSHLSLNYFWVHMVDYHTKLLLKRMSENKSRKGSLFSFLSLSSTTSDTVVDLDPAGEKSVLPFDKFLEAPETAPLRNSMLSEEYYSRQLIDSAESAKTFILPDLKQLPSRI